MFADIETFYESAPEGWDSIVGKLGGNVYHTTLWAEYQRQTANAHPVFILARDGSSQECAGTLALFRKSSWPAVSWIVREITLPSHPFIREDDVSVADRFVRCCEELARARGCSRLLIDSFMSGRSSFIPRQYGYLETERIEFSVDLSRDTDSLWKGIAKDQRERIKRLKRLGVVVEMGTSCADIEGLRLAREATHAKRARRGQGYELSSGDTFYEGLYEYLLKRGGGRLFVARQDEQVIAGLFFATFNKRACSVFSGSTDAGYKLGAQSGLFWEAVNQFKREGFLELNRGGVPASSERDTHPLHGIYQFKKRLGAVPQLCRTGRKILSPWRNCLTGAWESLRALRAAS